MSNLSKPYEGKTLTRKLLAELYGVSSKTFRKMLDYRNIILNRGPVCPKDVQRIFDALGTPRNYFR